MTKATAQSTRFILILAITGFSMVQTPRTALGSKFDDNDFLIAGEFSDNIFIYDATDYTFKGKLDAGNFDRVRALAFDRIGNVVSTNNLRKVVTYDCDGVVTNVFSDSALVACTGVGVVPNGKYLIADQVTVAEYELTGARVRAIGTGDYKAVHPVPGGLFWAGGGGSGGQPGLLNVYDYATFLLVDSVPFDMGAEQVQAMSYCEDSNTMLIADNVEGAIFERMLDGTFIRRFDAPGINNLNGVARGPNGHVFAVDYGPNENTVGELFHWTADGTFVEAITLGGGILGANEILWTGKLPVPLDGDFDGDGDVDLGDFSAFVLCFGGANMPPAASCPPGVDADLDDDGDVDLGDFSIFALNFTG